MHEIHAAANVPVPISPAVYTTFHHMPGESMARQRGFLVHKNEGFSTAELDSLAGCCSNQRVAESAVHLQTDKSRTKTDAGWVIYQLDLMNRSIRLSPVTSLAPLIGDGELVAFNAGPDGVVYVVVALKPLDYRTEQPGWASFAKTVPDQPQRYRVVGLSGPQSVLDLVVEGERFNIHDIQPLVDELLLVCARSYYKGPDDFEKNGRVYTRDGKFAREILLGDGIQSVQATRGGVIWTSYFDEGVFGNYGWQSPVGASGLVAWDSAGNKLYEFQPSAGLDAICDCYALNIESEEDVWLYYYTEFPLVRLHLRKVASVWKMPLGGSSAFAVSAGHALFRGGYKDRDTYQLFALGKDGNPKLLAKIELRNEKGSKLVAHRVVGRADVIHIIFDGFLYRVDVQTALARLGEG